MSKLYTKCSCGGRVDIDNVPEGFVFITGHTGYEFAVVPTWVAHEFAAWRRRYNSLAEKYRTERDAWAAKNKALRERLDKREREGGES